MYCILVLFFLFSYITFMSVFFILLSTTDDDVMLLLNTVAMLYTFCICSANDNLRPSASSLTDT